MPSYSLLRRSAAGWFAVVGLAAAAAAEAADINVTDARIAAGRLVVTGTTATPRMRVRLDGRSGADFNVSSHANRTFKIELVYLPSDCVVTLRSSAAGPATDAVVADCARSPSPRGAWSAATAYLAYDLVSHDGSTWLARRDNTNTPPAAGADWQLFARGAAEPAEAHESGGATAEAGSRAAARRDSPTGPAGGDLSGQYPDPEIRTHAVTSQEIAADAVTRSKIAEEAVTTGKIADGAVTEPQVADGAVTSAKILDESLTSLDLGPDSVGASEIEDSAIGALELGVNSVAASEIQNGSVGQAEIGFNVVGTGEIQDNQVGAADIQDGSVGQAEIASDAVTGVEIASNAVTSVEIAANAVGADEIVANAVGESEIQDGQVRQAEIASDAVTSFEIATNAVTGVEIASNAVNSDEVEDFGLSNQDIGVLFAEVNANATLANSSGGVTVVRVGAVGAGAYEVDFGRNIELCTAVATLGPAGAGVASGEIDVSDRAGNDEAVAVDTNDSNGAAQDQSFRMIVVC